MKRLRGRSRGALVAAAAMCVVAAQPGLPGGTALAGTARAADQPTPYAIDPRATRVEGAETTSTAESLQPGVTYRDSIEPGKRLVYRLDLDDAANAYVSATAAPELESRVAYGDELTVRMEDSRGKECDSAQARMLPPGVYPRPLTASASRTLDGTEDEACREAGPYHVIVERKSKPTSTQDPWQLELRYLSEPKLTGAGPTEAAENWPTASPEPPSGAPEQREGGAGFADAVVLRQGQWTAAIDPGESLFYRVPVDWGQQLFTSAELGGSEGNGVVSGAMSLAVYNPARGLVDSVGSMSYSGKRKSLSTEPAPPVDYANRFSSIADERAMRFAGWYYVRVSLSPEVGEKFGQKPHDLTLRVTVDGEAKDGPGYDGSAGEFDVPDDSSLGQGPVGAEDNTTMTLVAAGGIGTGTVLVLGLGGWVLVARRREAGR
ncbi:hypothetical protein [Streptomyces sp. 4R-3d]|uniref:hypothetical protein n=1 Tax=Streptomyces sp. 4R-3d TaxID=2559605 RepID=UPI00084CD76A|nr:hypothetical protein [Streptomyces sp. 4R-3d]